MMTIYDALPLGVTIIVLGDKTKAGKLKQTVETVIAGIPGAENVRVLIPKERGKSPEDIWEQLSSMIQDSPQHIWMVVDDIQSARTKKFPENVFLVDDEKPLSIPPEYTLAKRTTTKEFSEWLRESLSTIAANSRLEERLSYIAKEKSVLVGQMRKLAGDSKDNAESMKADIERLQKSIFPWKFGFFGSMVLWLATWTFILYIFGNAARGHAVVDGISGFLKGLIH